MKYMWYGLAVVNYLFAIFHLIWGDGGINVTAYLGACWGAWAMARTDR